MSLTQRSETRSAARQQRPSPREQLLTIGDVAKQFGVTLRTLRFYEDRGLITPYREGSSRFYGTKDRARLTQILKGKRLGFTLGEIRDMLAKDATLGERGVLPLKPEQIKLQISHLQRQRDTIDEAIGQLSAALKA